jgi:SAM-dependent methyltransferase
MRCRVCDSTSITRVGTAEYYSGIDCSFYDCDECGCRFAKHDRLACEMLHARSDSYYASYRKLAERCRSLFEIGDLDGLRNELSQVSKYRFVIEEVQAHRGEPSLLEIGCSRGYLTSYFILAGYQIIGADASPTAVAAAKELFGEKFSLAGSPTISETGPYDIAYHVGTIGCVSDPVGLTRQLLDLIKPGGTLLFNAPNRESLWYRGQLWIDSDPPPDVVTVFPPGFWTRVFGDVAVIEEQVEMCPPDRAVTIGVGKLLGRQWKPPAPVPLGCRPLPPVSPDGIGERFLQLMEGGARKTGRITGLSRFAPKQPYEFGLLVKMTKK